MFVAAFVIAIISLPALVVAAAAYGAPASHTKSPRAALAAFRCCFPIPFPTFQKEVPMSSLPGRRRAHARFADAHVRQMPADAHQGACEEFPAPP